MELSRFNKKMILLCEKSNALWHPRLTSGTYKSLDEGFDDVFGENTLRKAGSWRKKKDSRAQLNLEVWSQSVSKCLGIETRSDLFGEAVRASTFGEVLGIGPFGQRYMFDSFYSDINKSSFSALVYNAHKAEQVARSYCGSYEVVFLRDSAKSNAIGKLDIRYFVPLGLDSLHKKDFKIKCKLDLPTAIETDMDMSTEAFEYDGYLSQSLNSLSFHFESRLDAWGRRSLMLVLPTHSDNGIFEGRFLKTPFGTTSYGLSGQVQMKLEKRHDSIILPHSNLQTVG